MYFLFIYSFIYLNKILITPCLVPHASCLIPPHLSCLFPAARKDGRYRDPPPTPPGYTALSISEVTEGATHTARKPPDYTTALQRSRLVTHSPKPGTEREGEEEEEEEEVEEEGECLSPKLRDQRRRGPHTAVPPRP